MCDPLPPPAAAAGGSARAAPCNFKDRIVARPIPLLTLWISEGSTRAQS